MWDFYFEQRAWKLFTTEPLKRHGEGSKYEMEEKLFVNACVFSRECFTFPQETFHSLEKTFAFRQETFDKDV